MADTKRITIEYAPRRLLLPYHNRQQRWAIIVAHRRFGKTVGAVNDIIKQAVTCPLQHGRYAYIAPFLSQAKEVAWEYLKRYTRPIQTNANESELWVELINGSRIRVHGADNPDRLRGAYLDGAICDEYADWRSSVWGEVIRPMLADRRGSATFIGTPKGKNEFYQLYQHALKNPNEWFSLMLKASDTGILHPDELSDAKAQMTPEQYEQEFECSFDAAITGAYYGKELAEADRDGRIREVQYEAGIPVHTAWDLGMGDSTAIWFIQIVGKELRFIDHYENSGFGLDHYVTVLNQKQYRYGIDWVPHDARVRELGTGRSRIETLVNMGRNPKIVPDHKIMDGINAARLTIPQCWFDLDKCSNGIEALRQYRPDWDDKLKTFKDHPRHDWTSHTADAFRYAAMAWREMKPQQPSKPKPTGLHDMTMKDFLETAPKPSGRI